VPVDRATFRQDAETLGLAWDDLTGGLQKSLLEKAAKSLPEEKEATFRGLLEEVPTGNPVYRAYKDTGGGDPGEGA
jgi:hypothetical protein